MKGYICMEEVVGLWKRGNKCNIGFGPENALA
jgi:hypothetical protein